jgi:chemotaxis protein methyltransferase CheR
MIDRARTGCYGPGSLGNLPPEWRTGSFTREGGCYRVSAGERRKVAFLEQDVRVAEPEGLFHLILCRNVVFTYFEKELQKEILGRLHHKLRDKGALVLGVHEALPPGASGFETWPGCRNIFRLI